MAKRHVLTNTGHNEWLCRIHCSIAKYRDNGGQQHTPRIG